LLVDPRPDPWTSTAVQAIDRLLAEMDWSRDRVALMAYDDGTLVLPYGSDPTAVREALARLPHTPRLDPAVQPLALARAAIAGGARPTARWVLVVVAPAHKYRWPAQEGAVLAARALHEDGIRVISVTDTIRQSFLGAAIASNVTAFHVAPDRPALERLFGTLAEGDVQRVGGDQIAALRGSGWGGH
jgi:hypothetical protein